MNGTFTERLTSLSAADIKARRIADDAYFALLHPEIGVTMRCGYPVYYVSSPCYMESSNPAELVNSAI